MSRTSCHLVAACAAAMLLLAVSPARAQDAEPKQDDARKEEAQALMLEGFEAAQDGEHALALQKFQRAYETFPSPKILLNIGTTLKKLGRYAEAAATYEKYLAHPETDPAREKEVRAEIAGVDALVARVVIEVNVADAAVLIDGKPVPGESPYSVRVDPGAHTIVANKDGYEAQTATLYALKAGEQRAVKLELLSFADAQAAREREKTAAFELGQKAAIAAVRKSESVTTGGRLGAHLRVAVAFQEPAASAVVGASYGLIERLDAQVAAILAGDQGAYLGGVFYLTTGRVRPSVSAGAPVFFVDGVRPGARGAVGVVWLVGDSYGVALDVAGEHYFSVPDAYEANVLTGTLGIEARM